MRLVLIWILLTVVIGLTAAVADAALPPAWSGPLAVAVYAVTVVVAVVARRLTVRPRRDTKIEGSASQLPLPSHESVSSDARDQQHKHWSAPSKSNIIQDDLHSYIVEDGLFDWHKDASFLVHQEVPQDRLFNVLLLSPEMHHTFHWEDFLRRVADVELLDGSGALVERRKNPAAFEYFGMASTEDTLSVRARADGPSGREAIREIKAVLEEYQGNAVISDADRFKVRRA